MTREVPAGEFRAKCLAILDEVKETGEEIVVTRCGKPVARVVPPEPAEDPRRKLLGSILWQADDIVTFGSEEDWPSSRHRR
jgi:prevent-host-death family protein